MHVKSNIVFTSHIKFLKGVICKPFIIPQQLDKFAGKMCNGLIYNGLIITVSVNVML